MNFCLVMSTAELAPISDFTKIIITKKKVSDLNTDTI